MTINIPFDASEQSMELVKFSSLYFNKINLVCGVYEWDNQKYYDEKALNSLNSFRDGDFFATEKVDIYSDVDIDIIVDSVGEVLKSVGYNDDDYDDSDGSDVMKFLEIMKIVEHKNFNSLSKTNTYDKLVHKVLEEIGFDNPNISNAKIAYRIFCLYLMQSAVFFDSMLKGKNIISNNFFMEKIIEYHYGNDRTNRNDIIAMNALPIFLPDIHQMELDDILELRHHSKDELANMRYYIDNLSKEFSPDDLKHEKLKFHLEKKINPSIDELSRKVSGLKMSTLQKFISNFRDPKKYTPMLTTFFTNMPAHIALALSAGLIVADTAAEYKKQLNEIKNDPLYFSLQLRKQNSSWY